MVDQQLLKNFQSQVERATHIAIFGHDNPDGDAIWSMLWLWRIIEKMEKKVSYFASPKASKIFDFLPDIEKIQTEFDYSNRYDLIIFVDFSPYDRTVFSAGKYDYFDSKQLIVIDHHIGDTPMHALALKDDKADSNCEWIFENTKHIWSDYYDSQIATYLYMGVMTDTGNFQHDKQGDRSLRTAADLVALWADKQWLTRHFFGTLQIEQLQFFNTVFPRLVQHGPIWYVYFTPEDYLPLGLDKEQAGWYLTAILQKIPWLDLILICRGEDNTIKISLRSKNPVMSAQKVAESLWWGWHFYASGAKIELEPGEDPLERLESLVQSIPSLLSYPKNSS